MSNAVSLLNDQVSSLITTKAVNKAKAMILCYNGETDAQVCSEWLKQILEIVKTFKEMNPTPGTAKYKYLMEEFKYRWENINKMISKAMGKRNPPIMTETDKARMRQLEKTLREVFGDQIAIGKVVPFMLEAGH